MSFTPPRTDAFGIAPRYQDAFGAVHPLSSQTQLAIREAMGARERPGRRGRRAGAGAKPSHSGSSSSIAFANSHMAESRHGGWTPTPQLGTLDVPQLKFLRQGERMPLSQPVELILEDGTTLRPERELPRDLPVGYHAMSRLRDGSRTRLVVSPDACYLPESERSWGWAVQLYALRSKTSWGMGDLGDLKKFGRWAARELKCNFTLTNPLGAATPTLPQQASPYFPSSRRFWNPLYLCVEDVSGAVEAKLPLDKLANAGRALNRTRLIDRDAIFRLKMEALEKIWQRFHGNSAFEAFCDKEGSALKEFATFCALSEHFNSGWTKWPRPFRRPESVAVREFARNYLRRIQFHQWLQWWLDIQLSKAAQELPIMQDLPIGVDPGGADAWVWQDMLALGMTIGAPPDAFNAEGQSWGLPPFIPHRLRELAYEPFRQTIRAALRLKGGLRIDHVMGLFRLFWIPASKPPREGAFVYYPYQELLSILAIESHRAKAWVVGEDLGTVEPGVRAELWRRKILSYRLLWFESRPVRKFPQRALAAVTTHDLFTVAGLWNGSDLAAQEKLGLRANVAGAQKILKQLRRRAGLRPNAGAAEAIAKTYRLLAQAPSRLLAAALDDALAVEERPNMPGTTTAWPNWSLALPRPLERIQKTKLVMRIAKACQRRSKEVLRVWESVLRRHTFQTTRGRRAENSRSPRSI